MKRTSFQRLMALILCLAFMMGGSALPASAADDDSNDTQGSTDSIYDSSEVLELLNTISYGEYLKDANAEEADGVIVIDAVKDIYAEATDAKYEIGNFDGVEAVLTPATGTVAWEVKDVPKRALYTVTLVYYAYVEEGDETKADSIERVFKINDKIPFSEARYLTIKKNWLNDYPDAIYQGKENKNAVLKAGQAAGLNGKITDGELTFEYPDVWTSEISSFCE